ncbi:related to potassium channel beta subunit protein [Rhynchosporium graminicola]|uniref:Related to potassium channel beta subunit protein n=1 Tax=Rhynchosporium graminicola TaxID=2792576 RepID=A0A1E1KKT7_9HELO|nr:related to potassium channel beta subunit protein [Rhynchosporium commune]
MTSSQKSNVNVIFGAMTFGRQGTEQARVHSLQDCSAILDIFQSHGHNEIDTARFYGEGSSEEFLGDLDWKKRGLVMDTKFYPTAGRNMSKSNAPEEGWRHTPKHLRQNLMDSLRALNDLYQEGLFARFAISNYMAWEVAQICEICKREGYVMPSVYQGVYNALHRSVEPELFPCLRKYGMGFYNYNPLAGGYLTVRYHRGTQDTSLEEGSRFDPSKWQGKRYRARYWNDAYFDALEILRPVAKRHGLTEAECTLRWLNHHSLLKRENGDGIIIGASSTKHMRENMKMLDNQEPLPEEVVKALDEGWEKVKGISGKYWH